MDDDRDTRRQLARIRNAFGGMPYGPAAGIRIEGELPTLEVIADSLEKLRDCLRSVANDDNLDELGVIVRVEDDEHLLEALEEIGVEDE